MMRSVIVRMNRKRNVKDIAVVIGNAETKAIVMAAVLVPFDVTHDDPWLESIIRQCDVENHPKELVYCGKWARVTLVSAKTDRSVLDQEHRNILDTLRNMHRAMIKELR